MQQGTGEGAVSANAVLNKRAELYMKGGVFAVTYKQLVIDLLCKKVSPVIITGIIVNQAHKCQKEYSPETFLIKQIHKEASQTFVKCFSNKHKCSKLSGVYL